MSSQKTFNLNTKLQHVSNDIKVRTAYFNCKCTFHKTGETIGQTQKISGAFKCEKLCTGKCDILHQLVGHKI